MKRLFQAMVTAILLEGCASMAPRHEVGGLWDMSKLRSTPAVEWSARDGLVQQLYYQGEPYRGKPTRVFAYLARPASGKGPFPAMVLAHGGGGKAFRAWAEHWAKQGYVALAMDTAGCGPNGPLADGGPDQNEPTKFRDFQDEDAREMWTYHSVAAIIRGHSLLAALPEVDSHRIGITGISWGGYLTCIAAGIDDRFKAAVPVYGCGFLGDDSVWKDGSLAKMNPAARERWLHYFDPSNYLSGVKCPILFLDGSNDFAYPLDSLQSSYRLVRGGLRHVSVVLNLPHGHIWTFGEVDAFVDSVLRGRNSLPSLGPARSKGTEASASFRSPVPLKEAFLNYTEDSGDWQHRHWETVPAEIKAHEVTARLPAARPLVWFLSVTDERGLRVSTEHEQLAGISTKP